MLEKLETLQKAALWQLTSVFAAQKQKMEVQISETRQT
jgi:hypothetical protein